ncbi:hypothetical protein LR48_Vigan04g159300 [Vigna angularis]|uniref:Uncharacterized protein n=1 Tax=Phaseolus angularis TaxID=3914 RepID=A0A0L9UEP3_PHAAN|nr:hypothetical protein LR48_Vigan04g159300 [Vigna angularis]
MENPKAYKHGRWKKKETQRKRRRCSQKLLAPSMSSRREIAPPKNQRPVFFLPPRRRQGEADIHEEEHNVIKEHYVQEGENENVGEEEVGGFPGGPRDTCLLIHYARHVAHALWQGERENFVQWRTWNGKKLDLLS